MVKTQLPRLSSFLFSIELDAHTRATKKEKEIEGIKIVKEEMQLIEWHMRK